MTDRIKASHGTPPKPLGRSMGPQRPHLKAGVSGEHEGLAGSEQ